MIRQKRSRNRRLPPPLAWLLAKKRRVVSAILLVPVSAALWWYHDNFYVLGNDSKDSYVSHRPHYCVELPPEVWHRDDFLALEELGGDEGWVVRPFVPPGDVGPGPMPVYRIKPDWRKGIARAEPWGMPPGKGRMLLPSDPTTHFGLTYTDIREKGDLLPQYIIFSRRRKLDIRFWKDGRRLAESLRLWGSAYYWQTGAWYGGEVVSIIMTEPDRRLACFLR